MREIGTKHLGIGQTSATKIFQQRIMAKCSGATFPHRVQEQRTCPVQRLNKKKRENPYVTNWFLKSRGETCFLGHMEDDAMLAGTDSTRSWFIQKWTNGQTNSPDSAGTYQPYHKFVHKLF